MKTLITLFFLTGTLSSAFAMNCDEIREKAKPPKDGKKPAACVMLEQTPGITRGSTSTVYSCGGKKFTLQTYEDGDCTVAPTK